MVRVAPEAGLLQLGTLAIDGTKVKASASKHKAMSYGRMKQDQERLKAEIEELTSRAASADAQEDAEYGPELRGDEIPEELRRREQRLEKIRAAVERLRARQKEEDRAAGRKEEGSSAAAPQEGQEGGGKRPFGEPPDKKQDNFTDPQSRIMKTSSGFEQCYNAQIAVEGTSRLIVAVQVTSNVSDHAELLPVVRKVQSHAGQSPTEILADAGYRSEENLQKLEAAAIDAYISLGREVRSRGSWTRRSTLRPVE